MTPETLSSVLDSNCSTMGSNNWFTTQTCSNNGGSDRWPGPSKLAQNQDVKDKYYPSCRCGPSDPQQPYCVNHQSLKYCPNLSSKWRVEWLHHRRARGLVILRGPGLKRWPWKPTGRQLLVVKALPSRAKHETTFDSARIHRGMGMERRQTPRPKFEDEQCLDGDVWKSSPTISGVERAGAQRKRTKQDSQCSKWPHGHTTTKSCDFRSLERPLNTPEQNESQVNLEVKAPITPWAKMAAQKRWPPSSPSSWKIHARGLKHKWTSVQSQSCKAKFEALKT